MEATKVIDLRETNAFVYYRPGEGTVIDVHLEGERVQIILPGYLLKRLAELQVELTNVGRLQK